MGVLVLKLTILTCSEQSETLPDLSELTELKSLSISGADFTKLDDESVNWENIVSLNINSTNIHSIDKEIINKLYNTSMASYEELLFLLDNISTEDKKYLIEKSHDVSLKNYSNNVFIRGLIEFTNYCIRDCKYCGIRKSNDKADRYRLTLDEILECADIGDKLGYKTFVLQGGEDPYFTDEKMVEIITNLKNKYPNNAITLSLGERSYKSYEKMFKAGADRYLLRHETANKMLYESLHPNSSFENKIEFLNFFDIEGVKLDDTIVLGCVGVRTNAGTSISLIPKYTLDGLAESSSGRLDPIISLMIVMDMSGEISLKASIESNTSSYVEKGFNIQKEGYVGKGGSVEDNKGQKTYDLAFDRVADVYDRECNSRYELDKEPVTTLKGSLEGKASVDFGLGVGIGCFTMGIMPGMVRASGYAKFDSNLKGDFLISSENSDIGFEGKFGAELGIRVRVDGRVATDLGVLEFKYVKPWVLWSKGIGTSDDLKIVLTWSDLPRDLDSHLYTSKGNHIYYSNKYEYGYDDSNEYKKFIDLDIDDTSGWGPETTTIYEYTPGVYTFKVNDYTNRWDSNSYELSQSRAVVKVYKGDQELQTFVVPTEKKGTVWNVFSYDTRTDTITSINTIN